MSKRGLQSGLKWALLVQLALFANGCSTFYGGTTSSEGDQSITEAPTEISFESAVGTTVYKSVSFTNRSANDYTINNLAFVDNVCGAFSVYSVTDESGAELWDQGDEVSLSVAAGASVFINVQFSPESCETTAYTTTLVIYYEENGATQTNTVQLSASVLDESTDQEPLVCESQDITYYDEYDNPTKRTLPVLDTGEFYYLRVNKMSAYIYTATGFESYRTQVGTAINLADIDPDNWYQPVYIPFTVDADGALLISSFDECLDFTLPSPTSDSIFQGQDAVITLKQDTSGSIDRTTDPGTFTVPDITFNLHAFFNSTDSLVKDPDTGEFEINVRTSLTTGATDEADVIADLAELADDEGNPFLNVSGNTLTGEKIRHGTITLVGIGYFLDDEDLQLDRSAAEKAILIDGAYLFLQIEGLITQAY